MSTVQLKPYLVIGVAGVCFAGLFCGCKKVEQDKVKVTINSWVGFGPLYIAEKEGFFKENNLNIEIVKLEAAPDRRASLLADRVQVVASTLDDIAVTLSQGVDAAAFCYADYSNGGDAIIAKKEVTLKTLHEYEVAAQKGFVNHFFLLYVLHGNEISMKPVNDKIRNMEPSDAGAAFIAGKIDVAVTWEPFISQAKKKLGDDIIVLASSDKYPEAILDIFIAKKDWLESNPSFAESFRKSWDKAVEYLFNHPEESYKTMGEKLGIPVGAVKEMLEGVQYLTAAGRKFPPGEKDNDSPLFDEKKLKKVSVDILEIWKKAGYVRESIQPSDLEKALIELIEKQ
ncbi:MAG: ABC transporter substrate-binding protein [Kiritimatiellaeota bacterium]|nr:ABC transporter substrate-binding protein [Kiritimatiellota bacterium]